MVARRPTSERARRRRRRRCDGFTMIEVMVALLLLTIVMSGTMALQVTSIRNARNSRVSTTASMLARGRLERFRSLPYGKISEVTAEVSCFQFNGAELSSCSGAFFTRTTNVVMSGRGYQASVTVSWKTGLGSEQVNMTMERQP